MAIAYYLLKVIICSGILYGYYRLFLHNKLFHQWNRFYLLISVVISLVAPMVQLDWFTVPSTTTNEEVLKLLQWVAADGVLYQEFSEASSRNVVEWGLFALYALVSFALLLFFLKACVYVYRIIVKHPVKKVENIYLVESEVQGTPFSFFSYIFWSKKLDIESEQGRNIFKHELVHVQERHSMDRILMNTVLIFFWSNPIFWLIRRELNLIHEFIADQKSVNSNDVESFAEMILYAAYPQHHSLLTSHFFSSSIKRRLAMLTKMQNPKVSYISRVLALPLLAFIFLAFTLKTKNDAAFRYTALDEAITVVIDAGHGGDDMGAIHNGVHEKDITLAIAQKVEQLNTNPNIKVILTRDGDHTVSVKDRVNAAVNSGADLFVSIHVDKADTEVSKVEFYASKKENIYKRHTELLSATLHNAINEVYPVSDKLKYLNRPVLVLDANEINYPSILLELGNMVNAKDFSFVSNKENQEKLAASILRGIEHYVQAKASLSAKALQIIDTVPKVTSLSITPSANNDVVFIVDGKRVTEDYVQKMNPQTVESISVFKDTHANEQLGKLGFSDVDAKAGMLEIYTKGFTGPKPPASNSTAVVVGLSGNPTAPSQPVSVNQSNVTIREAGVVVEDAVSSKQAKSSSPVLMDEASIVIDGKQSTMSALKALSANEIAEVDVLKKEGNGVIRVTTKKALVDEEKVFMYVDEDAQFPGGEEAWAKYITKCIEGDLDALQKEAKTGTCVVQFIVEADGSVRDIEAITLKDSQLAKTAVDAIKKGPKWTPAKKDGKWVAAYRKMPVTFHIEE